MFAIDSKKYGQLLTKYQPKTIINKIENERALNIAETLSNKQNITPEEENILDLLIVLIENFENKEHSFSNDSTPLSRLNLLVEANSLKQTDLLDIFGSKGIASEVFNGKRQISKTYAIRLAQRFSVDAALFLI